MNEIELNLGKPIERNIYDIIARKIESSALKTSNYYLLERFSDFENAILRNERLVQDLREKNEEENEYLIKQCEEIMELWFVVINDYFTEYEIITNAISKFSFLGNFLEKNLKNKLSKNEINIKIYNNFHPNVKELRTFAKKHFQSPYIFEDERKRKDSRRRRRTTSIKRFKNNEIKQFALDCFKSNIKNESNIPVEADVNGLTYEWDIEIKIDSTDLKTISYLLWSLSEGLELIDGVCIELIDWGKGSFWVKFKLKFSDLLAKEEVKDVLEKSRKAAESYYIDKHIESAEKIKLENKKIEEELKRLIDTDANKEIQKLDLEGKQLDLLEKREKIIAAQLQNQQRKIDLINSVSEMIKSGIIKVDSDIQININDLLFASLNNGFFNIGDDINDIEKNENVLNLKDKNQEEDIK